MKRSILVLAGLSLIFWVSIAFWSTRSPHDGAKIRIGAPDDAGGLVLRAILMEGGFGELTVATRLESHTVKDCCSSTSEWALSTDELDGAVMCPDAAARLVERDGRFEIVGPCVLNSDAFVMRLDGAPAKMGIAQKRGYQEALVRNRFGAGCPIAPMLPSSLPYALARGIVDGIVVDGLKGILMPQPRMIVAPGVERLVTYVFVVRKALKSNPIYSPLMDAYGRTASALNDPAVLARWIGRLKGVNWTEREIQEWKSLKVQFVSPLQTGP
jgi:hypothetical protein